ncbi:MAG: hypothetical protein KGL12_00645 [Rhodospirillales bacterium]|nr:hypothetical protein [Rhodospirillales bacterium]
MERTRLCLPSTARAMPAILLAALLAAAPCLLGAHAARAQSITDMNNPGPLQNLSGTGTAVAKLPSQEHRAPAGLPGAVGNADTVAPADKLPADMDPTQALFDAINRGDLKAARAAVDRGADLHGHNVLGMTPVELSVDLSRNDITFMLLSFGAGSANPAAPPLPAPKRGVPARQVARAAPVHVAPVHVAPVHVAPSRPAPVRAASQPAPTYAELGGGSPAPSAGFLGFGQH